MGVLELLLIAVSLSMDAFAVALCKGLSMRRMNWRNACVVALFFGVFQALMPLVGWGLGRQFERYIVQFDHWIAFALLLFIGGKMVLEALRGGGEAESGGDTLKLRGLLILAVATSIDALAVGITFAFFEVRIVSSVLMIGAITFGLSLVGVWIGHQFGAKLMKKAEIAGGVVLILIGLKILLEHLGVFG